MPAPVVGFVTLLLVPLLGVLALLGRRSEQLLSLFLLAWGLGGAWWFATGHVGALRHWLLGLGLGLACLFVARLRRRKRTARWIKLGLAVLTVLGFVQALRIYLEQYA